MWGHVPRGQETFGRFMGGKLKKKKGKSGPIIVSIVILSVVGYLIYAGIRDTSAYYLTVSEVLAEVPESQNQTIRVGGNVSPGSVQWDPKNLKLVFKMGDEKGTLDVDYRGVVPDSFKPGGEVIVEGKYNKDGKFLATAIMPKCASKYE